MKILVTGCCGFIGFHLCNKLIELGHKIYGIDNFNDYYDINIKKKRFYLLKNNSEIFEYNIENPESYNNFPKVDLVINLAAQAGVRYSLINPKSYIDSNIMGFFNTIEFAKKCGNKKFIYASSASVYGKNKIPWSEDMNLNSPLSLYGATKISNELIADSYYEMFGLKSVGLRFFSVYGPYGRPDLSLWKWIDGILNYKPIEIFNYGNSKRSWTHIDDIIDGIIKSIEFDGKTDKFNLGSDRLLTIDYSVEYISKYLGIEPIKKYLPMQDGDISDANPDLSKSKKYLNFYPKIKFEDGIARFIDWFIEYNKK